MKRNTGIKKIILISLFLIMFIASGCTKTLSNDKQNASNSTSGSQTSTTQNNNAATEKNPLVTIEMEDGAKINIELYPKIAPNTVKNFISLVNQGVYDGLIFHRVIPDFMIQGGDPKGTGMGDAGYSIKGEFQANGFKNDLKHERGVISMARSQQNDSASSQFFIVVKDSPHLNNQYAAFGKVTEGMDEVDKIVAVSRDKNDKPLKEQKMKKVTVNTFGVDYGKPETIKK